MKGSRDELGSWFNSWKWLHYDEAEDKVLCHLVLGSSHLKGDFGSA